MTVRDYIDSFTSKWWFLVKILLYLNAYIKYNFKVISMNPGKRKYVVSFNRGFVRTAIGIFTFVYFCCSLFLFAAEKKTLDSINKQIKNIEKKLFKLQQEKGNILNEIYAIELRQKKATVENQRIKMQLVNTGKEIEKKKREKKKLRQEILMSKENIGKALRILYKLGGSVQMKFFTRVESFDELFKNYHLFVSLINYKSVEINRLKGNISKVEKIDKELQEESARLASLLKSQEQKIKKIKGLKKGKLNLIERINNDRMSFSKLINELKNEAAKLNEVLRDQGIKTTFGPVNIQKLRGNLKWPLQGKVISFFGKKKSTKFDTYIFNNGIEIKPSASDKIKAIYDGEVVFADYFKGYGNLIIVQHAKDFYSVYGHCERILKKKGDKVTEGEVISIAGNSGSTSGKSLYLEIRKDLKPENPLKWLSGR
jgi:septal ring factor EnvC (AmiA/AmiB activator)